MTATASKPARLADATDGQTLVPCWKCSGSGRLTWTTVDNGRCWCCRATGALEAGAVLEGNSDLAEWFIADATTVWHFRGIADNWDAKRGQTIDDLLIQVFPAGANLRRDRAIFRCRVAPEIGRLLWTAAREGADPLETLDRHLAHLKGTCALSRNPEIFV